MPDIQIFYVTTLYTTCASVSSQDPAYPWSNAEYLDSKTKHWRSTNTTSATVVYEFTPTYEFTGVSLVGANFEKAQIEIYDSTALSTLVGDSGTWTLHRDLRRMGYRITLMSETSHQNYNAFVPAPATYVMGSGRAIKLKMWGPPTTAYDNYLRLRSVALAFQWTNVAWPATSINVKEYAVTAERPQRTVTRMNGAVDYYPLSEMKSVSFDMELPPMTDDASNVESVEAVSYNMPSTGHVILNEIPAGRTSSTNNQYTYICKTEEPNWNLTFNTDKIITSNRVRLKEVL